MSDGNLRPQLTRHDSRYVDYQLQKGFFLGLANLLVCMRGCGGDNRTYRRVLIVAIHHVAVTFEDLNDAIQDWTHLFGLVEGLDLSSLFEQRLKLSRLLLDEAHPRRDSCNPREPVCVVLRVTPF